MIIECIELNWLRKYVKKVRSSQAAILLLNWVKTIFPLSILECIELNWWRKYMKKVRSSQAVILLLNWAKTQFFPVSIIKCSFIEKKVKQKERYISNCVFGGIYLDSLQHICSSLLLLDLHFSNQTRFDLKSISGIPIVIAQ